MNMGMGKAHPCIFSRADDPKKECSALREKYCMKDGKENERARWVIMEVATDQETVTALNRLARETMKLRLLMVIRFDLTVCELEGWDKREYIQELQEVLNGFKT